MPWADADIVRFPEHPLDTANNFAGSPQYWGGEEARDFLYFNYCYSA